MFWQPGCTSCLRTEEFLTRQGVDYESINVHGGSAAMEELRKLGARSVPSLRGERTIAAAGRNFSGLRVSGATAGHYEKTPVMRSCAFTSVQSTSYKGSLLHSCTSHNSSAFRNSSSESDALQRRLAVSGSCNVASAFSFIARLASR